MSLVPLVHPPVLVLEVRRCVVLLEHRLLLLLLLHHLGLLQLVLLLVQQLRGLVSRNMVSRNVASRNVISRNLRWTLAVDPQDPLLPGGLPAPHDCVDCAVLVVLLLLLLLLLMLLLLRVLLWVLVGVLALVWGLPHHLQAVALWLLSWHRA